MSGPSRSVSRAVTGPPHSEQSSNAVTGNVSPNKRSASHVRTEAPTEPDNIYHAFKEDRVEIVPCGNPIYEFSLQSEGTLGLFFKRPQYAQNPIYLDLQPAAYYNGCYNTLSSIILRAYRLLGNTDDEEVTNRTAELAEQLAIGVCVATYLKLRALHCTDPNQRNKFLNRPNYPANFPLPGPYALAITQLGAIKVSGLTTVTKVCPTLSAQDAPRMMIPANLRWNLQAYHRAVEFAKKLGLKFEAPDLTMKIGSSWWLFDNNETDDMVNFRCRLPEDNFTPQTAVIACLFAAAADDNFVNPIVDLTPLEDVDYGTMLRNPPAEFNVTCYLVLNDESEEAWNLE